MDSLAAEFDAFVHARSPALLRTAYLLTGDQHRAEDLVQDALIRTHRAWKRLHDSNPDAYTRKVMYHLQVAWWRRGRSAEVPMGDVPEPAARRSPDESHLIKHDLSAALRQLTPKQRAVIVLRFIDDQTEAATAEVLGVSVGTVKSQTARALTRLRALAPQYFEEAMA